MVFVFILSVFLRLSLLLTGLVWYFDLSPDIVHQIESPDQNVNINEPKIELNKLEEINI